MTRISRAGSCYSWKTLSRFVTGDVTWPLGRTPDETIWEVARESGFTIVTTDNDFLRLSAHYGAPPKVIRLERMDYSTQVAATLIRRNAVAIAEFGSSNRNALVLRRS